MDATGSAAGELREMAMQTKLAIYALAVTLAAIAAAGNRQTQTGGLAVAPTDIQWTAHLLKLSWARRHQDRLAREKKAA
jgi:hypothetical protein